MSQNWRCTNCQAINHQRRTTCWQCGYSNKKFEASRLQKILGIPKFTIQKRLIPQLKLGEKLFSFIFSSAFFLISISLVTGSMRNPSVKFSWTTIAIGAGIFTIGIAFLLPLGKRISTIGLIVVLSSGSIYAWVVSQNSIDANIESSAAIVCQGKAFLGAAEYNPQADIHPIVIIYSSTGKSLLASNYPTGWLPSTMSSLQLVACIEETWETIERCAYEKGYLIERKQQLLKISVIGAAQGQITDEIYIHGAIPQKCRSVEEFGTTEIIKTVRGDEVSVQTVLEELSVLVTK